ncbi:hypothetical protein HMPREF0179_01732 [Bilophila wadsworthia 3_1_6]|uniref:DUF4376 domain-containing protein n=2 Tax=Bilophila wadsworthia TaxID=35833 RepID=E5Y6B9_BILW3|nr:hypothetical protein HMPREF0179_01732 [Bilophila wadsworthia 3_1_6]
MDYGQIIHRTFDDSYVITKNSMSYHVPNEGEFAEEWAEVRAYAEAHPECVVVEQPYVPPVPTLEELKAAKKARIDAETSAAILAGFDYAVDGVNYHFSYALDDQQNFSDTANVCLMKQSGMLGLPDSVTWNAYTVPDDELVRLTFDAPGFLALYAGGAMKHKNETMQRGGERKAAVEAAATADVITAA